MKSVQIRSFFWSVFPRTRTEYEIYGKSLYSDRVWEIRIRKNSVFGHFSRSEMSRHINHRVLHQSISCVGFNASYAFDDNNNTLWYSSGWGVHDNNDDWIGYEFPIAVRVHAVRMKIDEAHRTASPKKIFVEAADTNTGPFRTKWVIKNPTYEADNVYKVLGTFFLCF